jgi:uncharacterized protein
MSRTLSPSSNVEALRREAKRWLKSLSLGDTDAAARFLRAFPGHVGKPKLREIQHALAREHGFASWAVLKQELEDRARTSAERVNLFLEKAVNRYGVDPATQKWGDYERDGAARGALAARLLARHPHIGRENIHTAVAAHDVDAVRAFLAKDPSLVHDASAFDGWAPLVRLAYARLPVDGVTDKAIAIATALLDAGADPEAGWTDGSNRFPALVGIIGGGEAGQSEHPAAERFARLLIERGADPFAPQALYNTSLGPDSTFWLDLLWSLSELRAETSKWTGPAPAELGGEKSKSALSYLLGNAVPHHVERTRWLLEHGAEADGVNFYSRAPLIKHALLAGRDDVADVLERHGATRPQLTNEERFMVAVASGSIDTIRRLAHANSEFLAGHKPMFSAIREGRTDVAETLIELGMSPDISDDKNCRALHYCAHCGAVDIARLLIARGAEIDPFDQRYGGTPLTHAVHNGQAGMVALLAAHSRNFRGLCFAGAVERLRELLVEAPDRANREDRPGEPALFCLPDDPDKAVEVAELLLSFGANSAFRNPLRQTPAQVARRRGLDDAAALLDDLED